MAEVTLTDVGVILGKRAALAGLTLHVPPGAFFALLGPNGAGKSTVLRTLVGLLTPHVGDVYIAARPVHLLTPYERARTLSYLPQTRDLAWALTGRDVVALGRSGGLSTFESLDDVEKSAIEQALSKASASPFAQRIVRDLSGGEQARVHLARVLASPADLILLDEPLTGLDPKHQFQFMEILRAEARAGRTIIAALHDLALAERYCSYGGVLAGGRVMAIGEMGNLLNDHILNDIFGLRRRVDGFEPAG